MLLAAEGPAEEVHGLDTAEEERHGAELAARLSPSPSGGRVLAQEIAADPSFSKASATLPEAQEGESPSGICDNPKRRKFNQIFESLPEAARHLSRSSFKMFEMTQRCSLGQSTVPLSTHSLLSRNNIVIVIVIV